MDKGLLVTAVQFFFCIFQSHASAPRWFHWFQYSRKRQFLRIRRSRASVIMPMLKTAAEAAVSRCFVDLKKRKGVSLTLSRSFLQLDTQLRRNMVRLFSRWKKRPGNSPFCTKSSRIFRRFHWLDRFLRGGRQPLHQPPELL